MNEQVTNPQGRVSQTITVDAQLESGGSESVEVKPLRVSQFPRAFELHDREDEAGLVELTTGRHPGWASLLSIDSYNDLVAALYTVNASGFFAYAGRRTANRVIKVAFAEQFRSQSRGSITSQTSGRAQA